MKAKIMKTKLKIQILVSLIVFCGAFSAGAQSLEDRVTELEVNQGLNIFKFKSTLIDRIDSIQGKNDEASFDLFKAPSNATKTTTFKGEDNLAIHRLRYTLGVDASVSKKLQVYAAFTMSKFDNHFNRAGTDPEQTGADQNPVRDLAINDANAGPRLYVEKAYFDYSVTDDLIFSAGRLPTIKGTPFHYYDARARLGTYPKYAYSATLDGYAMTYQAGSMLGEGQTLAARVIYTPFINSAFTTSTQGNFITKQPLYNALTIKGSTEIPMMTYMLDYSNTKIGIAEKLNIIAQMYTIDGLRFPDGTQSGVSYTSDVTFGMTGTTFMAELNDIAKSGLDLCATYWMSSVRSKGWATFGSISSSAQIGFMFDSGVNLGTGTPASKKEATLDGNITLLSARYRIPVASLNRPYVGAEWMSGSKESFYFDGGSDEMSNFYGNRGTGTHIYYTQPIEDSFTVRVGTYNQTQEYALPSFGVVTEAKATYSTYYANLRVDM